jgi:ABC-2 type transport system ATP-binding protein
MDQSPEQLIVFEDVSKFYGEILGVNRVNLCITPGIRVWSAPMVRARRR